ncbi:MAG: ribosome maturation factor RimP [Defluviitaleaceae bacterium]|nr:ribosome maturation factor RimP [Defluviitaleaceae bacterium]
MISNLEKLLTPTVEACEVELYDMEYVKEGGNRILRLFIDKEGGVDLNDCERVSHAVSDVLDEHDPIPDAYRLQVGSPGIERRLVKPAHFERYVGSKVHVRLFAPHKDSIVTGRKKFTGILTDYQNDKIILIDEEKQEWTFEKKQISACNLVVEY